MQEERQRQIGVALGAQIARARIAKGLTQEQVAELLGVGNEAISRIERGVVLPPLVRLFELADALNCRVDELLLEASDRSSDQAVLIAKHISRLTPEDRELVLGLVQQLVERLAPSD